MTMSFLNERRAAARARLDPALDWGEDAPAVERRAEAGLERALAALRRGDRVVLGPWRGEVGHEVVYWIPFLRRLVADHSLDPDQLVVVSRGGVEAWYGGIASTYVDTFDVMSADEYRRGSEAAWAELGGQKQPRLIPFERRILEAAGLPVPSRSPVSRRAPILHPSVMFGLFRRFWKGGLPMSGLLDRVQFERWPLPVDEPLVESLPDEYVVVRFYFRSSFADTRDNRAFAARVVSDLARRTHVVLLNTGLSIDDHVEVEASVADRVVAPLVGVAPERNLAAQTTVIAHASAFVGTFGGLACLPAPYGTPSLTVASNPEHLLPSFIDAARRAAADCDAPLAVLDTAQLGHLALLAREPVGNTAR
jgi:hypothetical protein